MLPVIWRTKILKWEIECTQNVLEDEKSYKQGIIIIYGTIVEKVPLGMQGSRGVLKSLKKSYF